MSLEQEIFNLIEKKCEGPYWDFKQQWYDQDHLVDLLHDIICMANNLEDRDAFIIIGVSDKFEILDIKEDKNRKNTHNLTDFLREKSFAGNTRPLVEVHSIQLKDNTLDVIVIKQSVKTPFYLTNSVNEYKQLKPFHIYTRINDTNTPKNSSADIDKVEILWRKRFGLDKKPIDLFTLLVQQTNKWQEIPYLQDTCLSIFYHEDFPHVRIKLYAIEDADSQEPYMNDFPDSTPHWFDIHVCFNDLPIKVYKGVGLDGCRQYIVAPKIWTNSSSRLFYYIKNSVEMYLSKILNNNDEDGIKIISSIKSILYFCNLEQFYNFRKEIEQKERSNLDIKSIQNRLDKGDFLTTSTN